MSLRSLRCVFATAFFASFFSVAQAQQEAAINETLFDDAPPSLADNLPPDADPQEVLAAEAQAEQQPQPAQPTIRSEMILFNSRRIDLIETLQQPIDSVSVNQTAVRLNQAQAVADFYRTEQYATIWTHETVPNPLIVQLQQAINAAADDALNPAKYHAGIINHLSAGTHYQDITALEILLTDAWLSLANDLANGLVDAKKIDHTWNAQKVSPEQLGAWLAEGINNQDVLAPLAAINAQDRAYQTLKRQYLSNRDANLTTDDLVINMERLRWMAQDWHAQRYIFVNIPSYEVSVIEGDGSSIYKTRAVVGRPDRQTPRFVDKMRHVVMSPTWTVPPTIMRKDKLPQLRANPGAFNGSYDAIVGGKVMRPSDVNWNAPNAANYALRQKPGPRNALGRVKFLFPNEHAIYLHDTPSKGLFGQANRAKSSGCIRLQDPMDFANLLLKGSSWTPERIKSASNQSKEQWANLQQHTPVYLVYWTTWADSDGSIRSAKDVYGLDAKLVSAYKKALAN